MSSTYPQRHPVYTIGVHTVHRGKLDRDDARSFWVEWPDAGGVMRPWASCWNEGDAIRLANKRHQEINRTNPQP